MAVAWRFVDSTGEPAGASQPFDDREAAERWLSSSWEELLDAGVVSVELIDGDEVLYRMDLGEGRG